MILYFVDSHIHVSDKVYEKFFKLLFDSMIHLNIQVYSMSEDLDSSFNNIDLKKRYFGKSDLFKAFVGIHPQYATSLLHLESFNDFFIQNIDNIDGIGEIGLDPSYTFDNVSNDYGNQKTIFNVMLDIAEKNNMPVSIHSRKSLKDVLEILTSFDLKSVVFHWYDGSKAFLRKINDLGYYVSFGPYLLYSEDKKALLNECDLSLLLLETDGPVYYKRCFENVVTLPTFIISLINFISVKLKKDFKEMVDIIYRNSFNYIHTI
jgi:TatD DNase family protein